MKRLLFAILTAIFAFAVWADVTDIIILKNGNEYMGNIQSQFSNGKIVFNADTSIVYLSATEIDRIISRKTKKSGEPQTVDIHLKSHPDTVAVDSIIEINADSALSENKIFKLFKRFNGASYDSDVKLNSSSDLIIKNVELLEDGSIVKYRDAKPQHFTFEMKDVRQITRPERDATIVNGLIDLIITKDRKYKGDILTTEPGKSIKIKADGQIYHILSSDIDVHCKVPLDEEQDVYPQSPIVNDIYLKNNAGCLRDVVLYEQNYKKGTFLVIDQNNLIREHKIAEISKIKRKKNEAYIPQKDFVCEPDSLYINRVPVESIRYNMEDKGVIKAEIYETHIKTIKSDKGIVFVESIDDQANLRFYMMPLDDKSVDEINKVINRSSDKCTIKINLADVTLENELPDNHEINKHNTLRKDYKLMPGYYAYINVENSTLTIFQVL